MMETFSRDGAEIPVPPKVVVHYFTKKYAGRIICERDGDSFRNCRLSDDGYGLICSVALSRQTIGMGLLCHNVIEIADNLDFPKGEQFLPIPEIVTSDGDNIMIYDGPSDNTAEIVSAVVLSRIQGGPIEEATIEEIDALFETPDLDPVHIDQS